MNKYIISLALAGTMALPASAQFEGDGYYRIQNASSGRYMTLADNHSDGIDISTTTADCGALETRKSKDIIISDPGSVFYIKDMGNNSYNIMAQGTDLYKMTGYYIKLLKRSNGTYWAYQTKSGSAVYLFEKNSSKDDSYVTNQTGSNKNTREWNLIKVSENSDNYIGITPNTEAGGKHYITYYTGFAYNLLSKDTKAYYITKVDEQKGIAVYRQIEGTVPANTPVIIECSSAKPADNKIKPLTDTPAAVSGNKLTGIYFNIGNPYSGHCNATVYDSQTMRTLNIADGKPVFNTSTELLASTLLPKVEHPDGIEDFEYRTTLQRNSSYIKVSASAPEALQLMSEEEYNSTGISDITTDDSTTSDIYNINGVLVRSNATSTEGLAKGVYIFKGKKVVIK